MIKQLSVYGGVLPDKYLYNKSEFSLQCRNWHQYIYSVSFEFNPLILTLNQVFTDIGTSLMFTNYQGVYSDTTSYLQGQSVSVAGVVYFSKINSNLANTPPSAYWQIATLNSSGQAVYVTYDNTVSGLAATNTQEVGDELASSSGGVAEFVASGVLAIGNYVSLNINGTVSVVTGSNIDDWIGVSSNNAADAENAKVVLYGGVDEYQSGLTIGTEYFVDTDGTVTTTDTGFLIGTAISTTSIQVEH